MQCLDNEQSEADKLYAEETIRLGRERWRHMVESKKESKTQRAARGNSHSTVDEKT
jgi:hypothetical protein